MKRKRIAWKKFGADLFEARSAYDMGLREAARAIQITPSAMCRIEQGKPVHPATFLWVCDWMGKNPVLYLAPLYTQAR